MQWFDIETTNFPNNLPLSIINYYYYLSILSFKALVVNPASWLISIISAAAQKIYIINNGMLEKKTTKLLSQKTTLKKKNRRGDP